MSVPPSKGMSGAQPANKLAGSRDAPVSHGPSPLNDPHRLAQDETIDLVKGGSLGPPPSTDPSVPIPTTTFDAAGATSPNKPIIVGKYELLAPIAEGGMGAVFRARDLILNRVVALKTIKSGDLAHPQEVLRFLREAQAVAAVDHPNIIRILEVGQHGNVPYFTMPFFTGGTLFDHLSRFGAIPRTALQLMAKVARAVQRAHDQGILHRDLKSANILLNEADEPFVSDFGLARFREASSDLTQSGAKIGTPAYMPPEQAAGRTNEIGPASDVWALGVILYEVLTGRRPFQGTEEELTRKILDSDPLPLRKLNPNLDKNLETIIHKCLEKETKRRYATAGQLAEDLHHWLEGEPISARPEGWGRRGVRKVRRFQKLAWMAVLAVIVGAAAGIVMNAPKVVMPDIKSSKVLQDEYAKLARGETVGLIGAEGPPAWSELVFGHRRKISIPSEIGDAPFRLSSGDVAILELLPVPPLDSYRIDAEVRHDDYSNGGVVGLYLGRSQILTSRGTEQRFFGLEFCEGDATVIPRLSKEPMARAASNVRSLNENGGNLSSQFSVQRFSPAPHNGLGQLPWRRLAIEAGPEKFRVFWEGEPAGEVLCQRARDVFSGLIRDTLGASAEVVQMRADFSPREGCGLWILKGAASFRNVNITPIQ